MPRTVLLTGAVTYYELRSTENADKARVGREKLDVATAEAARARYRYMRKKEFITRQHCGVAIDE